MNRGKDQVTRKTRLRRHLGGGLISDLSHEDDVGILAEDGPESALEGDPLLEVHLDLSETGKLVLHRVLHRHDVHIFRGDLLEDRVHRGGFSRSGRSRDDENAIPVP